MLNQLKCKEIVICWCRFLQDLRDPWGRVSLLGLPDRYEHCPHSTGPQVQLDPRYNWTPGTSRLWVQLDSRKNLIPGTTRPQVCTRRAKFWDLWKWHLAKTLFKINNTPPPSHMPKNKAIQLYTNMTHRRRVNTHKGEYRWRWIQTICE